jgi:alkanesulfonate monooxygenase SsuD/methylene tetrahydromethanopterin reductase-like flavin-dependent oxidoreductase (luciferase family)
MEYGFYTFADVDPASGDKGRDTNQRIKELREEIRHADELGATVFGVGEHHRADYAAPLLLPCLLLLQLKRKR